MSDEEAVDVISPHFPAEGIDYLTGNRAGVIFDMSQTDGTAPLADDLVVPRPITIASVVPSPQFQHSSETSREMTLREVSSSIAESYGNRWMASIPVAKRLGLEVGGSRDVKLAWARRQMSSSQKYAISSTFAYDFVEVTMKPPANALVADEFLRAFAILPSSGSWEEEGGGTGTITDADRRAYAGFLRTYGTHYVKAAKFGGSYETLVVAEACALVLASETGTDLEECANAKLSLLFSAILGIDVPIDSSESCRGLTSTGRITDAWESSTIKSMQLWRGGSFDETDSLQFNDVGAWVEDVKRNPRSFPTQLASIPDLFRELLGAYDFGEEYCLPCQTLKGVNLDRERFAAILRNLDLAFDEFLLQAKNEKLEEEVCTLTCGGRCGKEKPSDDCACPKPSAASCASSSDDIMEATIELIEVKVEGFLGVGAQLRMYTSGLGTLFDGKEYAGQGKSVSVESVPTTLTGVKGDTARIEVVVDTGVVGIKNCVGSADFPLELVGSSKTMDLNGPCTRDNNPFGGSRVGKNPTVRIDGSLEYPNCCDCTIQTSDAAISGYYNSALFLLLVLVNSFFR